MNKTISVVIPVYNGYDLLHALLMDIYKYNQDVEEVIISNDCSTQPEIYSGVEWWKSSMLPQINFIDLPENLNFLLNCNQAVEKASGDIIILVSNDVRIQVNITDMLRSVFSSDQKVILGGRYYQGSTGWNEFNGRIFPYLEGWLLIFRREDWEYLGGFDERFVPNDYEDIDFSTTAISEGYTLTPLSYSQIGHVGAATIKYSPERQAITERNRVKFAQKWAVKE